MPLTVCESEPFCSHGKFFFCVFLYFHKHNRVILTIIFLTINIKRAPLVMLTPFYPAVVLVIMSCYFQL